MDWLYTNDLTLSCLMDQAWGTAGHFLDRGRFLFYLVWPRETMYSSLSQVPRYVVEVFPIFIAISVLENVIRIAQGKRILRMNDTIASVSQGIFQEVVRIKARSIDIIIYCFVYENFRFTSLPWDSLWTWWFCFLFIDCMFYWAHRLAHEVNFLWAIHQAHHAGEEFTMASALRQAAMQPFTAWITYVPLALCIPPQIFLAHLQLGELFMMWVHTEVINKMPFPLEYIINTPSHHRVHHGRNRRYIDKNYAGVLIIWDRMFGTFEPEDRDDPPEYGLVHPIESYNPWWLQYNHWVHMFKTMWQSDSWLTRLKIPFYGPGWMPGLPRLGDYNMIPEVERPVKYFDPPMNYGAKLYVLVHFSITILFYHEVTVKHNSFSPFLVNWSLVGILYSITTMGMLLETKWFAPLVELSRCFLFFGLEQVLLPAVLDVSQSHLNDVSFWLRIVFLVSALICTVWSGHNITVHYKETKMQENSNLSLVPTLDSNNNNPIKSENFKHRNEILQTKKSN